MGNRAVIDFYHAESGLKKPHYHFSLYFQWFDLAELVDCLEAAVNRRYRFDQVSVGLLSKYLAGLESDHRKHGTEINTVYPCGRPCKLSDLPVLDQGNYRVISDHQKIVIEHRNCLCRRWRRVHVISRTWSAVVTSVPIQPKGV